MLEKLLFVWVLRKFDQVVLYSVWYSPIIIFIVKAAKKEN